MKYYVGVDIGGTNTKIGVLNEKFDILKEISIKTLSNKGPRNTFERIWKTVLDICKDLNIEEKQLLGIGLGIPGPVKDMSIVTIAANFSWGNDFNAKKLMEEVSQKPVRVENDVRTISLGEQKFGAARGYKDAIVIPIGTGIAAGMILDNKVISGSYGAAGEFGHIVVEKDGYKCGCGLTGCLETYTSAPGIRREAINKLKEKKEGIFYESFKDDLEKIEAADVFKYFSKNDFIAKSVIDNFCDKLAYGISMLVNTLNPEVVILAGGVSKSSDIIIPKVKEYLPRYALSISLKNLEIKQCELLDSAGIKGAASLICNI